MLNGKAICCVREAGKQKKPYKAEWAGYEKRRRSLQKRVIYICSPSKNECDRTEKGEIRVLIRGKRPRSVIDTAHLA
jgi:hypothetical protein